MEVLVVVLTATREWVQVPLSVYFPRQRHNVTPAAYAGACTSC